MSANNGFPAMTTSGAGLFAGASSTGLIQGHAFPDPATRFALRAGIVAQSETMPMFGGIPVTANIAPVSTTGPRQPLGEVLSRATTWQQDPNGINGFTVSDQAYNMLSDPSNPVPTAGSGQSINYYPIGSRARIVVAASPALVALRGSAINTPVSWDFQAQELVPFANAYGQTAITNATWASTNGGQITYTLAAAISFLAAGDTVEISGIISSDASGVSYNGQFGIVSNSGTTLVVAAPAGAYATYTSGGNVLAGGGQLMGVSVLDIQPSGCMAVSTTGGLFTWNFNAACAVIRLVGSSVIYG